MARPYKTIRDLIHEYELNTQILADELGIARCTFSMKMNARSAWTSEEMWKIMHIFNQPDEKLHVLFPVNGQSEEEVKRQKRANLKQYA